MSVDYLVTGKEGLITEIIPSIKADKQLSLDVKNALVKLVQVYKYYIRQRAKFKIEVGRKPRKFCLLSPQLQQG
jgi:hypothetical protein